jgi:hypothetical protein
MAMNSGRESGAMGCVSRAADRPMAEVDPAEEGVSVRIEPRFSAPGGFVTSKNKKEG